MFGYSEKKLAKDIGKIAKRLDSGLSSTYDPQSRSVDLHRVSDGETAPYNIYLGNLYLKLKDMTRAQRSESIEAFLAEVLFPKELTADELIASLALRARTRFELDLRRNLMAIGGAPFETVAYGDGDLLLELVADGDESIMSVSPDKLSEASISADDAYKTAAATLVRATGESQWTQISEQIWASTYEDDYDFSRLVAAGLSARFPFDGAPVVFAPSHSVCLATDTPKGPVLAEMIEIGNKAAESHRPFSQLLWTLLPDEHWARWTTTPGEDGHAEFVLQELRERVAQYDDQQQYLESLLQDRGEDSFVASYQVYERNGELQSVATYTLNLPSYLPETDIVALVDPESGNKEPVLGAVTWAQFAEALGSDTLKVMDDLSPPRFQLLGKLTDEQLQRLQGALQPV